MKIRCKYHHLLMGLLFLLHQAPAHLCAQPLNLVVTYIRGGAIREKGGANLQQGQVIVSGERIRFLGGQDFLIALSTGSHQVRYKISMEGGQLEKGSESWEQVGRIMRLLPETPSLVSRSDDNPMLDVEFATDSTINSKMLFTQRNKYLFGPGQYPNDANHFFFLQLQRQGKAESQPLTTTKDTLLIDMESFASLQEKAGGEQGSYYLGYFDKTNNHARRIAAFEPVFDRTGQLRNLVRAVRQALGSTATPKDIFNESYTEAYYFIGRPSILSLKELINTTE